MTDQISRTTKNPSLSAIPKLKQVFSGVSRFFKKFTTVHVYLVGGGRVLPGLPVSCGSTERGFAWVVRRLVVTGTEETVVRTLKKNNK